MPGKCKILLVLAVFLGILTVTMPAALAAAVDDCTCPAGGCLPGAAGQGSFQRQYSNGLGAAGQERANSYNIGSNQVTRLDVQNHYGLNNLSGVFKFVLAEYQQAMDDVGAGAPAVFVVDEVVGDLVTAMLAQVFIMIQNQLLAAAPLNQLLSCKPMPSADSSQLPNTNNINSLLSNAGNCNGITTLTISTGSPQSQNGTIYKLQWGQ